MSFEGKVALITGASSGIGADAARHLAKLGARVAIVGRNESRLNTVAEQIQSANGQALAIVGDVNTDAERIINETIQRFHQLDVLINNAGKGDLYSTIFDIDLDTFDLIWHTNLRSVIKLTKLAVPHLERTRGNVVNVSSISGLRPTQSVLAYGISKAALDQFTRSVALQLGPKGVRVNSVNPGLIDTPIFVATGYSQEVKERIFEQAKEKYPVGRTGIVSDTSAAIAFLASDAASFITGVLLPVDGGVTLH